jgi:hypothetical protein
MTSTKQNAKSNAGMRQDLVTKQSGCHKGEALNLNKIKMPLTDKEKESKKMIEDFILKYSKKKIKLSDNDYRKAKFELSMINLFSILDKLNEIRGAKHGSKCFRRNAKAD